MRYPLVQRGLIALVQVLAMGCSSIGVAGLAGCLIGGWAADRAAAALTSLNHKIRPNEPAIVIPGRTTLWTPAGLAGDPRSATTVIRGDGTVALAGTAVCYTTAIPAGHLDDRR